MRMHDGKQQLCLLVEARLLPHRNYFIHLWMFLSPLLLLLLFLFAGPAFADDAPLRLRSGGVEPVGGPIQRIRMDSEKVVIRLGDKSYTVDATFHLTNRGETKTVLVGFPKKGYGYLGDFDKAADFISFETWVNGESVPFTEKGGESSLKATDLTLPEVVARLKSGDAGNLFAEDIRWMVKHVTFPGGKTTITRVRYEAPYNWTDYEVSDNPGLSCGLAHYIYGTGRFWEGKIGKATFIIENLREGKRLPKVDVPRKAREVRISQTAVQYTLTAFEPAENAEIVIELCPPEEEASFATSPKKQKKAK